MRTTPLLAGWLVYSYASPIVPSPSLENNQARANAVKPELKTATIVANVTNPYLTRDSCGSTRIGNRVFWTCRDTEVWNTQSQQGQLPVIVSTAGWSDQSSNGPVLNHGGNPVGPGSTGSNTILEVYGYGSDPDPNTLTEYYPLASDECNSNHGECSDGTRWAIWPDSPPLVTSSDGDSYTAYTWISKEHNRDLTALIPEPAHSLYKSTLSSTSNQNTVPTATLVAEQFFAEGQVGFGSFGNVVSNGYAYLYGQAAHGNMLARVPTGLIEELSAYSYYDYSTSSWSTTPPNYNDTAPVIPNAGGSGQGTYYYSSYYSSYIWIGQTGFDVVADVYITTAPAPEGPWVEPYLLYEGPNGNGFIGAYSVQANPALLPSDDASENAIYITYTQPFNGTLPYVTPLVYIEFE